MAEVEAGDVHSGVHERNELVMGPARRAKSADDLGLPGSGVLGQHRLQGDVGVAQRLELGHSPKKRIKSRSEVDKHLLRASICVSFVVV